MRFFPLFDIGFRTMLKLYNTLTRQKEVFTPIDANKVRMYVCGMTVYDYCHLGHARVMVVFDMVARWLRASNYDVTYVRNITDIDDKIIKRAAENQESIGTLTQRFIDAMDQDSAALGVQRPDHEPRATAYVPGMIKMIETLIANGHAYAADNGDVYYAVHAFANYGKLSGKSLDDLRAGERVGIDPHKRDPMDFVLWKAAKPNEPSWESPWGAGRPGWHIECSVMSEDLLGEHFDIHGIRREQLSRAALRVTSRLQEDGFAAYVVGGAVRDLLLGVTPKDFDIATDATPEQVHRAFRRSRIIGRRFRIVHG